MLLKDTPLEKATRAIANERQNFVGNGEYKTTPVIVTPSDVRMARALIQAIREPTDEMVTAGVEEGELWCVGDNGGAERLGTDFRAGWQAMIDVILEVKKDE